MPTELMFFEEPPVEFRYGQKLVDPHDGLTLFGPVDADTASHPKSIVYGVLGTTEGIAAFKKWAHTVNRPILAKGDVNKRLWPSFPGFDIAFDSVLPDTPPFVYELDRQKLLEASRNLDQKRRTFDVVEQYMAGISSIEKRDESFNVLICIVPEEVWKNCRPKSTVSDGWGSRISKKDIAMRSGGQTCLSDQWKSEQYQFSVDFRRQLKARAMKHKVPLQIIRESTLSEIPPEGESRRELTGLTDIAWNLSTGLYYKAGGKPWKLSTARDGVCYIGISFRKTDESEKSRSACCAAQMFLNSGDGVVFLGERGPWYSPKNGDFHLTRESAKKLLTGVLETYKGLGGKDLTEIFLHSRSQINTTEFQGYREACPSEVKLVGVRVRRDNGIKLFRKGEYPVIRGTFLKVTNRSGFLWTSGYKPRLQTYDGWEVPVPLKIDIQHGDATIDLVAKDIFGLTKLNYNACRIGDSQPVTIEFSDDVGEILVSNPKVKDASPLFKFYI